MKKKTDKKKVVKKVAPPKFQIPNRVLVFGIIGIFFVIWMILFGKFLFSGKMIMGTDMFQNGHFDRNYLANALKDGIFPLWDAHLHGGMPFLEGMHGAIFYPTTLFNLIMPLPYAISFGMVIHVLFAGLFMFLCLRKFGLSKIPAFFGGLSYMLAPFFVSLLYAGQDGKMFVISLFPLAFFTLLRALEKERLFDYLLFGAVYLFMVISPHMQLAYFSAWVFGAYFVFVQVFRFIRKKKSFKQVLIQIGAFLLGVFIFIGVAAPQILPATDYLSNYSQRLQKQDSEQGYEYSTSWSLHWGELLSLVNHEYVGTSVGKQSYWSKNPFKLNSDYIGILPLLLGLFAIIFSKRRERWFFMGVSIFTAIFALGANTPFYRLFYLLIPQVNKFRAPAMIIFLFGFSTILLAAMGLEVLLDEKKRNKIDDKKFMLFILISGGVVLASTLALTFAGSNLMTVLRPVAQQKAVALETAAKLAKSTAWLNTFFIFVTLGIMFLLKKGKLHHVLAIGIISIIVLTDLWRVNSPYINVIDPDVYYSKLPIVEELEDRHEKEGPFRVFTMPKTFNMEDTYFAQFGFDEVTFSALHGNQLIWYDQFVGRLKQPPNLYYPHFWNVLNIEYVCSGQRLPLEWEAQLKPVGQIGRTILYHNPNALQRAMLFEKWEVIDSTEFLAKLEKGNLDYKNTLYLHKEPEIQKLSKADSLLTTREATITGKERINSYTVNVDAPDGGILFISESYYPHWKCYEGEKELPIIKANFAFRGIPLEAGKHKLEFKFENPLIKKSFTISIVSFVLAICLGAMSFIVSKKKQ